MKAKQKNLWLAWASICSPRTNLGKIITNTEPHEPTDWQAATMISGAQRCKASVSFMEPGFMGIKYLWIFMRCWAKACLIVNNQVMVLPLCKSCLLNWVVSLIVRKKVLSISSQQKKTSHCNNLNLTWRAIRSQGNSCLTQTCLVLPDYQPLHSSRAFLVGENR